MQAAALNTAVFVVSFACAFLLAGKRPVLARSTRVMLLLLVGLATAYALLPASRYHADLGAATLIANALFVLFGAIDFFRLRAGAL